MYLNYQHIIGIYFSTPFVAKIYIATSTPKIYREAFVHKLHTGPPYRLLISLYTGYSPTLVDHRLKGNARELKAVIFNLGCAVGELLKNTNALAPCLEVRSA